MQPYYQHAGITIYHGDCREIIDSLEFDVVVTDPPYGVNLGDHLAAKDGRTSHVLVKGRYSLYDDTLENFRSIIAPTIRRLVERSERCLVFTAGSQVWELPPADAIGGVYLPAARGRSKWGFSSLSICLLYGAAPDLQLGAKPTAIAANMAAEKNGHPCPKPIEWMRWAVSLASRTGETILDPFMGSGTTLRAAKDLGRKAIGIEIEEKYAEIAAKRLSQEVLDLGGAA